MNRTVVIHQPDFLPWMGYFHRLLTADVLIVLDHVQFSRRGWTHRDMIKTRQGAKWLSLQLKKAPFDAVISDIMLSPDQKWCTENLDLLRENYRGASCFGEIFPLLEQLYRAPYEKMVGMNLAGLDLLENLFDTRVERMVSSEMSPVGTSTAMLVDLLKKAGATHYISGQGARAYLDVSALAEAGIELVWQEFSHPVYPQQFGEFVPMLSSIDVLLNCGARRSCEILREG